LPIPTKQPSKQSGHTLLQPCISPRPDIVA
jgi:hypothetical protein